MNYEQINKQLNSPKNLPHGEIDGTIIVTGASGSIGSEVVKSLLRKDFTVIMACRNLQKGDNVRNEILKEIPEKLNNILLEELDMSSFESIRKFADNILNKNIRLCGLMNNAGTLNRNYKLTQEGLEETIGVNYFGIVLLTKLLLPKLEKDSGIINVVSMTSNPKRISKEMFLCTPKNYKQLRNYGISKSALMLYTSILAEQLKGNFYVNAADPGIVDTNILKLNRWFDPLADIFYRPFIKSPKRGAIPLVNAQISRQTGKLFWRKQNKNIPESYKNHPLKEWFLEETEKIISSKL